MQGPRRISSAFHASDSLGQLGLNKRGARIVGGSDLGGPGTAVSAIKKLANAGRSVGGSGSSSGGQDWNDRATEITGNAVKKVGISIGKGTAKVGVKVAGKTAKVGVKVAGKTAKVGVKVAGKTAKVGVKVAGKTADAGLRVAGGGMRIAGKAVKGGIVAAQKRMAAKAAKKIVKKAAAEGTVTAGRGAVMAARASAAASAAMARLTAAIASLVTSMPALTAAMIIMSVVIAVISFLSWIVPMDSGSKTEAAYTPGAKFPIGIAPGPWGDHQNGNIPKNVLSAIPWDSQHFLRADATESLVALGKKYKEKFGHDFQIIAAYRDYAGQQERRGYWCGRGQCGKAAVPGHSNHGWALAVDLGRGINEFGTEEYNWMKEFGPKYGWQHPPWAEPGGSAPEPWHWEFWGWDGDGDAGKPGAGGTKPVKAKGSAQTYAEQQIDVVFGNTADSDAQFACLHKLWMNESDWNPLAKNDWSGAYGIPQALPAEQMSSKGSDWKTNPNTQIDWGLDYIKKRYKTPCAAWSFWQSNNPHWY